MSKHKMTAWCPFGLESDALMVHVEYTFSEGRPAKMYLRNGDPGYPADPPEVNFVSATLHYHPINDAMQKMLDEWAIEYLASDDGFRRACDRAIDDDDHAREYAAELRAER